MHLSTFFVYRVSGAYSRFMVLVLLSKIGEIDTFKATNLHQNAIKTYSKAKVRNCKKTIKVKKIVLN